MKIIKRGVCLKKDELAFICSECGCYFAVGRNECTNDLSCICPDCSAKVYALFKLNRDLENAYQVIGQLIE